ncbi:Cupin 1 [Dillenia turbinata]|uniref:Cupin 1 n=1 Tax=Dillenia turbinata TaxID=194707 RepID=A0AAN8ZJZ2_9MAGN
MAKSSVLILSLCILAFTHRCLSYDPSTDPELQGRRRECELRRISTQQPIRKEVSEAGVTEFWDQFNEQFESAGVAIIRHTIESRGLLLPSYTNAPRLAYISRGRGVIGVMAPGCPETYQSQEESQKGSGQRFRDQHQKIGHYRQGDLIALPAGVAHWCYNDGDEPLVALVFFDTSNDANQLDSNYRRFSLAGNPQEGQRRIVSRKGQEEGSGNNIFGGFDTRILAEAFGVSIETARKLQNPEDQRGHIVRVEGGLEMLSPTLSREQQGREYRRGPNVNGLEETICSSRLIETLADPTRADVYTSQAGRLSSLNSYTLPILEFLQLSVEHGRLYKNAMMAPHCNLNAHSVIYGLRGSARVQIVSERGQAVFDDVLREGDLVIAPQNFALVKQAENQGFEWVAFKTNANAMISTLAGKTSVMRGLPLDVIANAYQISREEASSLKYNREEVTLLAPTYRSSGRSAAA